MANVVGEDKPPETITMADLNQRGQREIENEFLKIQSQKEDAKKRLDPTMKNLNEYLKYKKRHEYNVEAALSK